MKGEHLKIFVIGPAYPLRGQSQFNENLCIELNKAGHDAQIISYSLQYPAFLFPGSSQYESSGVPAPQGVKIHTLINTVNPFNWFKVAAFIKKEKPDFIMFRFWLPFFGPSLGTIGRLVMSHTKVLALTDNVIPHEKRPGDALFTKYFLNSCHGFLAMSHSVLKDISRFSDTKPAAYTPHPMFETYGPKISREEARKKLGLSADDKIVLFFGLIRHYKGLDLLLEAMAHPEIKKQNIKLLIAGEFYEDKKPYLDLIEKHQLKDQVILHGQFIANDEVRYYFCASNLVAQTYRNATNSGVTMVGYYYEKPMLLTNVGGLAEIVPNESCGYIVEVSVPEISEKIISYFSQNKEEAFTQNVIQEKKKYEWPAFIEKLIGLYRSVS